MDETKKTNKLRNADFFEKYLKGRVIDIGCGPDPVVSHAEPYDIIYGHVDAGKILSYRNKEYYDCVYSSHCLEHMENVPYALRQWWKLVKPGGFMILVVPDEDLYEQGVWPSRFNSDHKATFRLHRGASWSPVSYNITELIEGLRHAEIISSEKQDAGYIYFFSSHGPLKPRPLIISKMVALIKRGLNRCRLRHIFMSMLLDRLAGAPVDQTLYSALAQIQIVVQKNSFE